MMDNIIQDTIQYTRQRKIFTRPVLHHQSVYFRLAELQTEVELLRSLAYRAIGGHGSLDKHDITRINKWENSQSRAQLWNKSNTTAQFWPKQGKKKQHIH